MLNRLATGVEGNQIPYSTNITEIVNEMSNTADFKKSNADIKLNKISNRAASNKTKKAKIKTILDEHISLLTHNYAYLFL